MAGDEVLDAAIDPSTVSDALALVGITMIGFLILTLEPRKKGNKMQQDERKKTSPNSGSSRFLVRFFG